MMHNQMENIILLIGGIGRFQNLMKQDLPKALHLLHQYQINIDQSIFIYNGQLKANYFGNACMVSFQKAENAFQCALALHRDFQDIEELEVPLFLTDGDGSKQNIELSSFPQQVLVSTTIKNILPKLRDYDLRLLPKVDSVSGLELFSVSEIQTKKKERFPSFSNIQKIKRKKWLVGSVLASLLILGVVLFSSQLISSNSTESKTILQSQKKSIAVLPFTNLSNDEPSFFADGVMEEILTHLAKFKGLKVISRTSSMQYKSTKKSIPKIAKELGVQYVLEGSVRQWDNKVRITVQLIEATEDEHIWAETYERKLEDIFSIQSKVSKQIAIELNQNISPELSQNIDQAPTNNLDAYNALIESRALNRIRTKASMEESLIRLDHAIQLDPKFVDAIAEKAATINVMSLLGYTSDPSQANQKAEQLALQAIKFDPTNHTAYATLGNIYFDANKWKQSETAFQIAIQHNPNDALANYWYSLKLRYLGQIEDAIHYGSIAAELDPLYPVIQTGHALTCMMGDRMDLAKAILEKGALIFENYFGYHWVNAYYKMAHEQYEAAIIDFNTSQKLSPAINSIERQIMYCKAKQGKVEEVEVYIAQQTEENTSTYINRASAYAGLGKNKESIDNIRKAWDKGGFSTGAMFNVKFKSLLDEPEYQSLLEEMKQAENKIQ